jgi:hypothetical protein
LPHLLQLPEGKISKDTDMAGGKESGDMAAEANQPNFAIMAFAKKYVNSILHAI